MSNVLKITVSYILPIFLFNSDGKVNPSPVISYWLEAEVFQQIYLTTELKPKPMWELEWQNRT